MKTPEQNSPATGKLLKTGELARLTGLSRQALHLYVQTGLLVPADETRGGQRLFSLRDVERVELIRKLVAEGGYNLRELRELYFKDR